MKRRALRRQAARDRVLLRLGNGAVVAQRDFAPDERGVLPALEKEGIITYEDGAWRIARPAPKE